MSHSPACAEGRGSCPPVRGGRAKMGLSPLLLLAGLLLLAAAFRLPRLAARPMHADEANQAVKSALLWQTGVYEYDTTDQHGPSLYWLTLPSLWLSGAADLADSSESEYRTVPLLFGIALVGLLLLFADGLGWPAVAVAGIFTGISPALVFFSLLHPRECCCCSSPRPCWPRPGDTCAAARCCGPWRRGPPWA